LALFHHPAVSQRPVPALYQICNLDRANSARLVGSVTESYRLCADVLGMKDMLSSSECTRKDGYMLAIIR